MTIAAGFVCEGGIVLCADSQYSGRAGRHSKKLWYDRLGDTGCRFAMAGAGAGTAIWSAHALLKTCSPTKQTVQGVAVALEAQLAEFYARHAVALRDQALELLIAIQAPDGVGLFLSDSSSILGPVSSFACIGSNGSILGSWIAEQLFSAIPEPDLRLGKATAACVLDEVMRYDPDTGGEPVMIVVPKDSRIFHTIEPSEFGDYSRYLRKLLRTSWGLASYGLREDVTREQFRETLQFEFLSTEDVRNDILPKPKRKAKR